MNENSITLNSYLTFSIGKELFAAPVEKVLEILEIPRITKVPRSPEFMRGVINLRGTVLPVVDSRIKFGLPAVEDTIDSCIIVMKVLKDETSIAIGVVVDNVQEVLEIENENLQQAPSIGSKYNGNFINGMTKINDHFIIMLNIDAIFSEQETSLVKSLSKDASNE